MNLTRDQILKAQDIKTEVVEVPEWGGPVLVQGLTGTARDAYEVSIVDIGASSPGNIVTHTANLRARMAAAGIVDENGNPLFDESDIEELGRKSAAALDRVCDVIRRLSGMRAGAGLEALKNSKRALRGASTTD